MFSKSKCFCGPSQHLMMKFLKKNGIIKTRVFNKKEKVDEYLIFVASEKPIPWLPKYSKMERLKRQLSKTNILMEKHISGYILIK